MKKCRDTTGRDSLGLIGWALISVLLLACQPAAEQRSWAGTVRDSAGVTLVVNPAEGLWRPGQEWTVAEDLRIGSFGGDADYQFAQIGSIVPNSRGEILVFDRQTRLLSFFSGSGVFIRAVGEPGSGPGEFALGVTDVFVGPGDTLLIPDVRNRRVHRFDPSGALLGSAPLDVDRYRPLRFKWAPPSGPAAAQLRPARVLVEDDTASVDELRLITSSGEMGPVLLRVPSGALLGPNVIRYFTPEPAWALNDSLGVHYAVNSEYRILSFDAAGRLRRVISKPFTARPITDRDIRAFFAYLDRAWLANGVSPSQLQANHRRVSFADVFPAFALFMQGPDGSLWVQPVRAPGDMSDEEIERYNFLEDFGSTGWEVFDREGVYLGVVQMPPRFQPRLFIGDAIYGVARDDFDVQYAVRLRIERNP